MPCWTSPEEIGSGNWQFSWIICSISSEFEKKMLSETQVVKKGLHSLGATALLSRMVDYVLHTYLAKVIGIVEVYASNDVKSVN